MGIDLKIASQKQLLNSFKAVIENPGFPKTKASGYRYYSENSFFNSSDAIGLSIILDNYRPKKIIEIGSGFSSAWMLDSNNKKYDSKIKLHFIEPYPDRLNSLINEEDSQVVEIDNVYVQDVSLKKFMSLEENDLLFIDSSHVSKVGSDLNFLLFQVVPRLKRGVLIHFHDIMYPFEYPYNWVKSGIHWNEAYLLKAFLMFNNSFEIILFNSLIGKKNIGNYGKALGAGGSIYLRKKD